MTVLDVVQVPDPVLNKKAKQITFKEPKLKKLILDMVETLEKQSDPPGVGLAGPQVGVSLRIFIAGLGKNHNNWQVFINPEILEKKGSSLEKQAGKNVLEGCLSLKDYYGQVKRHNYVKIRYQTLDWKKLKKNKKADIQSLLETKTEEYEGFEARIMLHETDHLNGVLYTHHLIEQKGRLFELQNDNGQEEWAEVEI